MDITDTLAPRSDQLNYDDVASRAVTVTVDDVRAGSTEQPVEIHLVEFPGRPFKPSKSMRRVIAAAWGPEASAYAGRKMTLFGDPSVKFGGSAVGGIRISHLSHLDKRLTVPLTVTRGKRAPYVVEPLAEQPAPDYESAQNRVAETTDLDELRAIYADMKADGTDQAKQVMAAVMARKDALQPDPPDEVA